MITRKFNKTYTETELNAFISSLATADTDKALRKLGYINASAFKGYGALTDEMAAYNALIYRTKQVAMEVLAEKANDVVFSGDVLYFRLSNGIQISFHVPYNYYVSEMNARHDAFLKYQGKAEWDGVQESYTYDDVEAYNAARQAYLTKVAEDNAKKAKREEVVLAAIRKYLANGNRRKSLGMTMTLAEFKAFNPFAEYHYFDLEDVLVRFGMRRSDASYTKYQIINIIGIAEWNQLNTFNFKAA